MDQLAMMTRIAKKNPKRPKAKSSKNAQMTQAQRLKAALMPQITSNPKPTLGQPTPMSDLDGDE